MSKGRKISHIQREKLREMPDKKRGFKRLSLLCKEILEKLEKEGPLTRGQIMKLTGIPHGTIDRHLRLLIELKCIERIDGKYVRYSDIYIYRNKTDRDLALDHSKNVASGLQYLISHKAYTLRGMEEPPSKPDMKYREPALEHLRTASEYRKIYNCLIEAEEARKKEAEEESIFTDRIKAQFLSSPVKLGDGFTAEIVAGEICKDIKEVLKGSEPPFLNNLRVEDGKIMSNARIRLAEEGQFKPLKKFIFSQEQSEENRNACKSLLEFREKYDTTMRCFMKFAEHLIMQVLNGTPLIGRCDLCPRVVTMTPSRGSRV